MRDLLPVDWSDQQRHDFLVGRLAGDEIDSFACEVAALSLILADYPNQNGWHIAEADLFEDGILQHRMKERSVEIGRASCRERVCQYVSSSVVAVSLKKKKQIYKVDMKTMKE